MRSIGIPGSPPRMRGKLRMIPFVCEFSGITPADAGKTKLNSIVYNSYMDHPRGCGENYLQKRELHLHHGSPPRMRGKHLFSTSARGVWRITPADAGKTASASLCGYILQDHPRGCGENAAGSTRKWATTGSPPRMRGKPRWSSGVDAARRITPADAGKTVYRRDSLHLRKDHPRGCGENALTYPLA